MSTGLARSVQTRLVRHANAQGADPNVVLARYASERLLYRLSRSPQADRFVLKGALMLVVWLGESIRLTRDADLLGYGDVHPEALARTIAEICAIDVEPDGLIFDAGSIRVNAIRPGDVYGGQRVTLLARLGPARLRVQLDIGVGDAVVPEPEWVEYPSLLDLPRPRLRAYRPETAIAEKVHTMVVLASNNSRMRDFYDVHSLAMRQSFDGGRLADALRATFERRRTAIPEETPIALTAGFARIEGKGAQWAGFVRRNAASSGWGTLRIMRSLTRHAGPPRAPLALTPLGEAWAHLTTTTGSARCAVNTRHVFRIFAPPPDSPGQCEPGLSSKRPRDPRLCYRPELSPRATRSSSS